MNLSNSVKAAKTVVTSKAGRQILKAQKNSPTLLFGAGVVGVVATAVLASKATLKLNDIAYVAETDMERAADTLDLDTAKYTKKDYDRDVKVIKARQIRSVVVAYTPAVLCGAATIGAFTGSHVVLSRRYAGVVAAYTALDRGFSEYRERVTALIGPDKERELRFETETREVAVDTDSGVDVKTITSPLRGLSPYAKEFSRITSSSWDQHPEYNLVFLRCQQAWANDRLKAKGHVFLNEVYDDLGLERTKAGQVVGWVYNNKNGGDNYIDFGVFTDRNREEFHDFMTGREGALWLDFNVDGVIYDLI